MLTIPSIILIPVAIGYMFGRNHIDPHTNPEYYAHD